MRLFILKAELNPFLNSIGIKLLLDVFDGNPFCKLLLGKLKALPPFWGVWGKLIRYPFKGWIKFWLKLSLFLLVMEIFLLILLLLILVIGWFTLKSNSLWIFSKLNLLLRHELSWVGV